MTELAPMLDLTAESATGSTTPFIEVRGLTKRFGEVLANDQVAFDVRAGEVHALLGENGAGKSTLMKLLYGVYHADEGDVLVEGEPVEITSPAVARALGIGMVFQDLRLVPAFTVAENISMALDGQGFVYRRGAVERHIRDSAEQMGFAVDPGALVRHLAIGERQRVEILKVLMAGARMVILDEPTSVLAPQEVDALFGAVDELRSQGLAIVIITHKLHEARAIADRVSVLRGGRIVARGIDPTTMDDRTLIGHMVGREVPALPAERPAPPEAPVPALAVRNITVSGDGGHVALRDVDLAIASGELVGIAGVSGNGQRELFEAVLGLRPLSSGSITIDDTPVRKADPRIALAVGGVGIPEDPLAHSVVPGLSVLEHMVLSDMGAVRKGLGIDWNRARSLLGDLDERTQLRIAAPHREVASLSGGNVQRVILTRTLGDDGSRLVVAAYPSRGLDIATTRRTQELLLARRAAGAGVLLISEDLDELLELSDRIAVLHAGELAGIVRPGEVDRYEIGRLMLGGAE